LPALHNKIEVVIDNHSHWFDAQELLTEGLLFRTPINFVAFGADSKDGIEIGSTMIVRFSNGFEKFAIHGKSFQASVTSVRRLNLENFLTRVRFTNITDSDRYLMREFIKELLRTST